MNDISVYMASKDNSYICGDDQIFANYAMKIKNQIKDAERVHKLAQS